MALSPGVRMHDSREIDRSTASGAPLVVVPVTTNTITLTADNTVLYVNPAGTIAALTILLPPGPVAGALVAISFAQIVTTLTMQAADTTAVATTAGAVATAHQYRYINATIGWVRWS